ncbi:hypothetical protein IIC38_07205 [candidate division KSB1 bacterium]|nr:hypothetical protein [candidate division KSB1 bacterium]
MNSFKFRKSHYFFYAGLFIVAINGCADRKHENPLDPENPFTEGKLTGLSVISLDRVVSLTWDDIEINGYVGTKIFRRTSQDSGFVEIAVVPGNSSHYDDQDVSFDIIYKYKIQAITEFNESPLSDEVVITPGPSRIWVAIRTTGKLFQLTHDASHTLFSRSNFFDISGMANIGNGQGIWLSDFFLNQIAHMSLDGEIVKIFNISESPLDLDFDPSRNRLWIILQSSKKLAFADTSGNLFVINEEFSNPVSISVDRTSGICWISDVQDQTVTRFNLTDTTKSTIENLDRPEDIAVNYQDGSIWVADVSSVKHFSSNMELLISARNFNFVYQVSINQKTGDCWALDLRSGINNSQLIKLDKNGSIIYKLDGFTNPTSLDVDEYDGSCVVTDAGNFNVTKISEDGRIIGKWNALGAPNLIRISSP